VALEQVLMLWGGELATPYDRIPYKIDSKNRIDKLLNPKLKVSGKIFKSCNDMMHERSYDYVILIVQPLLKQPFYISSNE
jgi:hypothetical protein